MKKLSAYLPHGVVFLSSMGVMIIELVASRIISKYFGNSLFTWTGVIGVILGGISLGNYLGGRLADKHPPRRLVTILLLAASGLVFSILLLDFLLGYYMGDAGTGITALLVVRSLAVIGVLFLLPAAALGTISPVMAKYALESSATPGSTVGSIYAVSSIGSIFGTFLCGYLLIPWLGVRTIVFMVGIVMALLALGMSSRKLITGAWTAAILAAFILTGPASPAVSSDPAADKILFDTDSHYMHMTVKDRAKDRILIMDGLIHNMHDKANPDNLLYDYEKIFLALTRQQAERLKDRPLRTLTVGGGALTFPSFLSRNFPAGVHEVAEIDPTVVKTAYEYFWVPRNPNLKIHVVDARLVDKVVEGRKFDLVYLDAFNSFSVPYHLTTIEYLKTIQSLLSERGVILINCIDIMKSGRFISAYHETLMQLFPDIKVYSDTGFDPARRMTFVLSASSRPFGSDTLVNDAGAVLARIIDGKLLEDAKRRTNARVLTDDYAPVENLMAPVFLGSIN